MRCFIILLFTLFFSTQANGQRNEVIQPKQLYNPQDTFSQLAVVYFKDSSGKNYIIEYQYGEYYFLPTEPHTNKPHYVAAVYVYEQIFTYANTSIYENNLIASFPGIYVEGGCYENSTEQTINIALNIQNTDSTILYINGRHF